MVVLPRNRTPRSGRWPSPRGADPNPENRREQLLTRRERVTWVGAGLGALIVLITSDLAAMAPQIFPRLVVLFVVLGGGALAQARVSFASKAARVQRGALDASEQQRWGTAGSWPAFAEFCYWAGLLLVAAAGICYCVAVWWPGPERPQSPAPARAFTLTVGNASLERGDRLLAVPTTCSQDCAAVATAFVSPPVGARLGLNGRQLAAGKREPLHKGERTRLVLRIRPCRARALRRLRNVQVRMKVSALEPVRGTRATGNAITVTEP
jgi:hypothetical protein